MNLEFKPISAKDIDRLTPFYMMRRNKTCDSVFLESFLWREYYNVRYAIWEDRALLWLMEYKGRVFSAMPLCREEDLKEAFHVLEQYFNEELGYPLVINLADEEAVKCLNLSPEHYLVKEEEGAADYIYSAEALKTLSGKKLHKKKNHLNAFKRNYEGRYEYRTLTCDYIQDVWKFLDRWREKKGEDVEEHLDFEVRGIHEILRNCCSLNIRMGGIYVDGELEAFSIGSYNPLERMAVIHIEKANPEMRGLYQLINQQFLLEEFPGIELVNREDDLGLEGLRKAKMSYCPIDFAKKYLVQQISFGQGAGQEKGFGWAEKIGALADTEEELTAAQLGGTSEDRSENTVWKDGLRYADEEEKQRCRELWHEAFPDDSVSFADYYYGEKVKDNRILVKAEEGKLVSMAQLNPYSFVCRGREWPVDYIVGVATAGDSRHRGHMRSILKKMLEDMNRAHVPFTFLMPADEAIYRPFQFAFIYRQPRFQLTEKARETLSCRPCSSREDAVLAASFMEQWLKERFEAWCRRDEAYAARLMRELASEDGILEFLMEEENGEEKLAGLHGEWGLGKREQRLLYAEDHLVTREKEQEKPAIMARVTDVEAFFQMVSGGNSAAAGAEQSDGTAKKTESEPDGYLEIADPFLPACAGRYEIVTDKAGGARAVKTDEAGEKQSKETLALSVDGLAQWLFGFRPLSEIAAGEGSVDGTALPAWTKDVRPIDGVFLDEVV